MSFEEDIKKWGNDPTKYKWEVQHPTNDLWMSTSKIPTSLKHAIESYRLIEVEQEVYQKRIKIPKPETQPLALGKVYFTPALTAVYGVEKRVWENRTGDHTFLEHGLVYRRKVDAARRTECILKIESVTKL